MNRDLERLVGLLGRVGEKMPPWDEAVGERDATVDRFSDALVQLDPGAFGALHAAIGRRRLPVLCRYSVRAAARAASSPPPCAPSELATT